MPVTSFIIRKQLNVDTLELITLIENLKLNGNANNNNGSRQLPYPKLPNKLYFFLKTGHKIGKAEPLFKRVKDDDVKALKQRFAGKQDETAAAAAAAAGATGGKKDKKQSKQKQNKPSDASKNDQKQDQPAAEAQTEQVKQDA